MSSAHLVVFKCSRYFPWVTMVFGIIAASALLQSNGAHASSGPPNQSQKLYPSAKSFQLGPSTSPQRPTFNWGAPYPTQPTQGPPPPPPPPRSVPVQQSGRALPLPEPTPTTSTTTTTTTTTVKPPQKVPPPAEPRAPSPPPASPHRKKQHGPRASMTPSAPDSGPKASMSPSPPAEFRQTGQTRRTGHNKAEREHFGESETTEDKWVKYGEK